MTRFPSTQHRRIPRRAWQALALAPAVLGACYTYTPVSETPKPGMHVAVDLNDRGRVGVSERVGPEVARIEGVLERSGDTARVLRVTAVTKIGGERSRWAGEAVSLRNEYVKDMAERRLSKSRTALAAGVAAAAVAAFIVTRELVGGGDPENPGGIIDPNPTLRVRVLRVP